MSNQFEKCIEFVSTYVGIQPTRKGDFILRSANGNEISRHNTIEQARSAGVILNAEREKHLAEIAEVGRIEYEFKSKHADLFTRQIAWQDARGNYYDRMEHFGDNVGRHRAVQGMPTVGDAFGGEPEYPEREKAVLAQETNQYRDEFSFYHGVIVPLDTRLKNAWREYDAEKITSLLGEAEKLDI